MTKPLRFPDATDSRELVWSFSTARFMVTLCVERDYHFEYDGEDEDGEIARQLRTGELIAFDGLVRVYLDGAVIASDSLCGSVYHEHSAREFWTAHRDPDPMNRNCMAMRAAWSRKTTGAADPNAKVSICHYFPDMVREAVRRARDAINSRPKMRAA